ncbi:hypothetical protein AX767_10800 [Variovorax sp. PAMC 28711]|nr:hypothetical protein AX767_10800 [Variovorax sp. PAMC 28711]
MPVHRDVIVIGGATGSVGALCRLLSPLPADFPAALLAALDTEPEDGIRDLVAHVASHTRLQVSYAAEGEDPMPGHLYLARSDVHLALSLNGKMTLRNGPRITDARPAADPLFETAAEAFGPRVICIVLSGEDHNGMDGMKAVHAARGICIAQSPSDAIVPTMPMNALLDEHIDHCVLLDAMPKLLMSLVGHASH